MEWTELIWQLIGNGLFPIVVCGGLFWALITLFKSYREDHKETADAIKNNTVALTKLCDMLDSRKEK